MISVEKQKTACFLNLAVDFLSSGYKSAHEYQFKDVVPYTEKESESERAAVNSFQENTAKSGDTLLKIAADVRACRNCPLGSTRTNAAPGEGASQPLVLVIGEGPGAEEDAQGRPFVGRAGQLLDKMLASIGLSRNNNCFIANVIKCRPPNNRDPYPEETAACAHFLERQINILNPKFILVVGRIAAQTLLKTTEPIGKLRGKVTDLSTGKTVIPLLITYHPAALLRNEELKRPAWDDLKLLRSKLEIDLHDKNLTQDSSGSLLSDGGK
jgi:DNA polymerase